MSRSRKILLLLLAALLLTGVSQVQNSMNLDRERLDLTRVQPLENAPPVLAFTTVALGGFRGLISNVLWIRANDLQDEDKFFEMAQLADWITKLEPYSPEVWKFQAWNMAYNISVKFKDFEDRWRWLQRGIELLRDQGLHYNPNDVQIHWQLAWLFQHKLGASLDDANMYYKQQWANEMAEVFGKLREPNLDELVNPQTEDQNRRATLLKVKFKMDPQTMKQVDEKYGPLEWRLPEAHAIYWAYAGLQLAAKNPTKVNHDDIIQLRRVIYQSMLLAFQRGRLEMNPIEKVFDFGPNLDIISKVNDSYEGQMKEDPEERGKMESGHRNFLRQAIYSLYVYGRMSEAAKWFKYLGEKYPDKLIIDGDPNSFPRNVTLDQYAVACVETDINETSRDRVKTAIEGLIRNSYVSLVLDQDDRAAGLTRLAQRTWDVYMEKAPKNRGGAIDLPPIRQIAQEILNQALDPTNGMPPEAQAVLRTKLKLGNSSTNSVPEPAETQK